MMNDFWLYFWLIYDFYFLRLSMKGFVSSWVRKKVGAKSSYFSICFVFIIESGYYYKHHYHHSYNLSLVGVMYSNLFSSAHLIDISLCYGVCFSSGNSLSHILRTIQVF